MSREEEICQLHSPSARRTRLILRALALLAAGVGCVELCFGLLMEGQMIVRFIAGGGIAPIVSAFSLMTLIKVLFSFLMIAVHLLIGILALWSAWRTFYAPNARAVRFVLALWVVLVCGLLVMPTNYVASFLPERFSPRAASVMLNLALIGLVFAYHPLVRHMVRLARLPDPNPRRRPIFSALIVGCAAAAAGDSILRLLPMDNPYWVPLKALLIMALFALVCKLALCLLHGTCPTVPSGAQAHTGSGLLGQ